MSGTKALKNKDLFEQLRESEALFQISQMLARSIDLPTILSQIVDATASLIPNAEQSVIHLADDSNTMLRPVAVARPDDTTGTSPFFFRAGEGIAGRVIAEGITINVTDTLLDERFLPQDHGTVVYRSLLVAPIKLHAQIIGTLSVESYSPGAFSDYYVRVLTSMGEQAALAIERAQILKEEQEQRQLAEALREASNIQGSETDLQSVLRQILKLIRNVLPYDYANVMLIEDGYAKTALTVEHQYTAGQDTNVINSEQASFEISSFPELMRMIDRNTSTIIKDTSKLDEWKNVFTETRAWVGVPIHAKGRVIAIISLQKKEAGFYEPKHAERLSAFANQASLTIQNAQLFETTQRSLREVNFLYQISRNLAESLDTNQIIKQVSELLKKQFRFYHVQFLFLNQSGKDFHEQQFIQSTDSEAGLPISVSITGIPGHVTLTNQAYYSNNVQADKYYISQSHLPETVAELAIPLRTGDRLYGVLDIHHKAPNTFKQDDLQLLFTIAEQISLAIEKSVIYDDLQKTLSKELAARAQLVQSEKLAALGRIVASVAHELNNPLQAIQNALYLINLEDNLNEQAREDIVVALNEAERMADLISRLRETYRPTTREEFQSYSINNLVVDVEKLIGTHLRRNNVTFHFSPGENIPDCFLIQDQIKQVILNISLNAVESMPNGGTLTISTHLEHDGNQVRLEISDTGAGIPQDVLPYIFDPFVTTKDRGTGLGLAITYDIVSRHGGRIEPESQPGQGTTFHVWLPVEI